MSAAARRRRALVLAGLALLLGGLAASDVAGREAALDQRLGPAVPVVVARAPIGAGDSLDARALAVREVPARFAPHGAYAAPGDVAGRRAAADIPAGADVTAASLADPAAPPAGAPVRRGERVAEVVAAGPADVIVAGTRVDVLVTREPRPGSPGGTDLALEDVEVLSATRAPADGPPKIAASLRVSLRQAVYLAAAQGFAREVRLLPRAAGDRRRTRSRLGFGADLGLG